MIVVIARKQAVIINEASFRRTWRVDEEGETYEALIKPRSLKWNRSEMSSEICTEITLRTRSLLDFSVVKQWISN